MAETRKIAAILAADVVGFSRMASADEDRTLARLRALRAELIDPTVSGQNGRVFKRTGDGALVEFRSVVEAVRCAITVQNAMVERNVGMSANQRIDFRIGIHLGDVVEESDGDLMGDGVNIDRRTGGDLSFRGRLSPGERQARYAGHRSRSDAAQEHRKIDPGLLASGWRSRAGEACDRAQGLREAARAEIALAALGPERRDRCARCGRGGRLVFPRCQPPRAHRDHAAAGRGRASLPRRVALYEPLRRSRARLFR
jgi:Adenylate and Guanylate cyclase catalytic domain